MGGQRLQWAILADNKKSSDGDLGPTGGPTVVCGDP